MGRAAAAAAPADPRAIMEARRAAYREEQGLPDVKWACFEEQRRHEDFAAVRARRFEVLRCLPFVDVTRGHLTMPWVVCFSSLRPFGPSRRRRDNSSVDTQVKFAQKQAALQAKNAKPDRKVTDFVRRIRRVLDKKSREHGGTEGTYLREYDLGVPACGGAFTSLDGLVSIRRGRGWFFVRFWGQFVMLRAGASSTGTRTAPAPSIVRNSGKPLEV